MTNELTVTVTGAEWLLPLFGVPVPPVVSGALATGMALVNALPKDQKSLKKFAQQPEVLGLASKEAFRVIQAAVSSRPIKVGAALRLAYTSVVKRLEGSFPDVGNAAQEVLEALSLLAESGVPCIRKR